MDKKTLILVIEDNEDVRENLCEILELYGYETASAPDGLAGIKKAFEVDPHLIICDIMMPQLDGYGVLNILSKNEQTAHTPFIFLTAKTEKQDIRRGMNLGADDYITKPFYKDELLSAIETRLKKAENMKGNLVSSPTINTLTDPKLGLEQLLDSMRQEGRRHLYKKKENLVREGDNARYLYYIESGFVHCRRSHEYGKDYILRELGKGEFIGHASLLDHTTFPYAMVAASETCSCLQLPAKRFYELINENKHITSAVLQMMAGTLHEQSERLVNQAYDSVRRRTALVLCDLNEKHDGQPVVIQREDLAQMVGTTKESVIRALTDFKTSGLVEVKSSQICIPDVEALKGLSI